MDTKLLIVLSVFAILTNGSVLREARRNKRQTTGGSTSDKCDITILLDSSGSMTERGWNIIRNYTIDVVNSIKLGADANLVSVVKFSDYPVASVLFKDGGNQAELVKKIGALEFMDWNTDTPKALKMIQEVNKRQNGARDDADPIVLLVTDGEPNILNKEPNHQREMQVKTAAEAKKIRDAGVEIFVLGLIGMASNQTVSNTTLEMIASEPKATHIFHVKSIEKLLGDATLVDFIKKRCPGIKDKPDDPDGCNNPANVVFMLDSSGSLGKYLPTMKNFIKDVIVNLGVASDKSNVALIKYNNTVETTFGFSYNVEEMKTKIDGISNTVGGETHTWLALNKLNSIFPTRRRYPSIAVLVSDGESTNRDRTIKAANDAKVAGATFLCVAPKSLKDQWMNTDELRQIASDPDNTLFSLDTSGGTKISDVVNSVTAAICNVKNECQNDPCQNGGTCQDMILSYNCLCRDGFAGVHCEMGCRERADIVFAIDSSDTMGSDRFYKSVNFAKEVIRRLKFDNWMQAGALVYAGEAKPKYNLNTYDTREKIYNATEFVFTGGDKAYASNAIREMHLNMFQPARGDLETNPNLGVIISNGQFNDWKTTMNQTQLAHAKGIQLLVATHKKVSSPSNLEFSAIAGMNNIYRIPSTEDKDYTPAGLGQAADSLVEALCNNVDECAVKPCQNGGTCTDAVNSYSCRCAEGFSGKNCDRSCSGIMDIIFAVDASGSVKRDRFNENIKPFLRSIVDQLEVGIDRTRLGVMTYDNRATDIVDLNGYLRKEDILAQIMGMPYGGGRTNVTSALYRLGDMFANKNRGRRDVPQVAILVAHGGSNWKPNEALRAAAILKGMTPPVHVVVVAILEDDMDMIQLKGMASDPYMRNYIEMKSFSALGNANSRNAVLAATCNDKNECNPNPCKNSATCADRIGGFACSCTTGNYGRTCDRQCSWKEMDIVFIIDRSRKAKLVLEQYMAKEIIWGLNITQAKVGVVLYGESTEVALQLGNGFTSKDALLYNISFMGERGADANIAAGINLARDVFSRNGRPTAKKVAIVLASGKGMSMQRLQTAVADARAEGITFYVVGVDVNNVAPEKGAQRLGAIAASFFTEIAAEDTAQTEAGKLLDALCVQ